MFGAGTMAPPVWICSVVAALPPGGETSTCRFYIINDTQRPPALSIAFYLGLGDKTTTMRELQSNLVAFFQGGPKESPIFNELQLNEFQSFAGLVAQDQGETADERDQINRIKLQQKRVGANSFAMITCLFD